MMIKILSKKLIIGIQPNELKMAFVDVFKLIKQLWNTSRLKEKQFKFEQIQKFTIRLNLRKLV